MQKLFDVLALGEALIELNQIQPEEPCYLQGFGGDTSNAVIAAARSGAKVAYLSRVGADTFGQLLLDLWTKENVHTGFVEVDPLHQTGIYFVTHGTGGHAFNYVRSNSAASHMTPDWLQRHLSSTVCAAKILHVSGISLAISAAACETTYAAMHAARAAGTMVSFDSNLRLKLWSLEHARACIYHAISLCDVFLPSLEDMTTLTGIADPYELVNWCHGVGVERVVLKLGANGALVSEGVGPKNSRRFIAGHQVECLDATGAGDCFCGNILAQLAMGTSLIDAAIYANAAAAIAVQGFGAVDPLPYQAQVSELLRPKDLS